MLEHMPHDAYGREMLYQHDLGVTRLRRIMRRKAEAQIKNEVDLQPDVQPRRHVS
jgi:hypothetical protein